MNSRFSSARPSNPCSERKAAKHDCGKRKPQQQKQLKIDEGRRGPRDNKASRPNKNEEDRRNVLKHFFFTVRPHVYCLRQLLLAAVEIAFA
jgi:hypothetical protein